MAALCARSRSQIVYLFYVAIYFLINGVQGRLTKTPQNVVVLRGQDATVNCSTDDVSTSGQNPIIWRYDTDIIVTPPCATHNGIFITALPDATTGCNIRALASYEHGISGSYRCSSDRTQALATVIVHDPPVCEVVQPVIEGRNAILMCRMTYDWQAPARQSNTPPKLNVSLTWTDTSGITVKTMTTTADRTTFSATIESNMTIENAMSRTIPSYRCTIQFDFSNGSNPYIQYAVNSVSSPPCVIQPTTIWYCPSTVTVSPSGGPFKVGDVLTCMSDGFPEPSYTWTDGNGVVVSTGPNITLIGTHFKVTCTATSNFTTPCNASETVSVMCTSTSETSSVPAVVSAVLGVIIALLVVVIISLSIAIHRLRRALQQQKSASRSAACAIGDQSQGRQPVPSARPVYTLPTPEPSSPPVYEEMNLASNTDPPNYARLRIAAQQPVQSQQSTTDDYLVPAKQLKTDHL